MAGILKHIGPTGTIVLSNVSYKGSDLATMLSNRESLDTAAVSAHAAWLKAAKEKNANLASTDALVQAIKEYVLVTYGGDANILADFGIVEKPRKKATVTAKAKAVVKGQATRAAKKGNAIPAAGVTV